MLMQQNNELFLVRIVTSWNRLPAATVLSGSLQSFRKSIEDINFNYAPLDKYYIVLFYVFL